MNPDLVVRPGIVIPARELVWRFSRSSGPGGQSVNTTDSRVSLSFNVAASTALTSAARRRALERLERRLVDGVITVHAERERSQHLNRLAAMDRMAALLRQATAPPPRARRPTKPSARATERRIEAKKKRGRIKQLRRDAASD
jgi:ribosome-associated protein